MWHEVLFTNWSPPPGRSDDKPGSTATPEEEGSTSDTGTDDAAESSTVPPRSSWKFPRRTFRGRGGASFTPRPPSSLAKPRLTLLCHIILFKMIVY